jgi:hypothetical protein
MDEKIAPGTGHCLCGACGEYFNSVSAFDKHRTGEYSDGSRRCLTPTELTAKGWLHNARGLWITSAYTGRTETEDAA